MAINPFASAATGAAALGGLLKGKQPDRVAILSNGPSQQLSDGVPVFVQNANGSITPKIVTQQLFQNARPVRCNVIERSQPFEHPIETGQVITDYAIVLPVEIEMAMLVEAQHYTAMYQQIRSAYLNKTLLTVQSNATNYKNMVIFEMPHEETTERFGLLSIVLLFKQVQLVPNPDTYSPSDPTQQSTQTLGQKQPYSITSALGLPDIPAGVQSFISPVAGVLFSSVPSIAPFAQGLGTVTGLASNLDIEVPSLQSLTSISSLKSVFSL